MNKQDISVFAFILIMYPFAGLVAVFVAKQINKADEKMLSDARKNAKREIEAIKRNARS